MQRVVILHSVCFILMSFLAFSCFANDFGKDIANLVEELSSKMKWDKYPIAVGLGNFFYADGKISSEFGYHFASEIEVAVTNMWQFSLVTRSRLDEILNEQGLQVSDLVESKTARPVGRIRGLDAMLAGRYSAWGKEVRVTAELIRVEDGMKVTVRNLIDSVPDNVAIKPPNYEVQKQRIEEKIQNWVTEPSESEEQNFVSDFHVTIEPDRRDVYREGDKLKLYVKSSKDCYIEIYNVLHDGSTQLIFPNKYWLEEHSPKDNLIKANARTLIPPDSSFDLRVSPPYGIETLKVIASTKPFGARTRSFYQERGAFPAMGNIDLPETVETLKHRARSVLPVPGSSGEDSQVTEDYCTILTEPLD